MNWNRCLYETRTWSQLAIPAIRWIVYSTTSDEFSEPSETFPYMKPLRFVCRPPFISIQFSAGARADGNSPRISAYQKRALLLCADIAAGR